MSQHSSSGIRTALFRVFVLPNLSKTAKSSFNGARNVHFGTEEDLRSSINKRSTRLQKASLHPEIIETNLFPSVTLVPNSSSSRALQTNTPLSQLRARLEQQNATKQSTGDHEHLVMIKGPVYQQGQEPALGDLTRLRAPESLIKAITDLVKKGGGNQGISMRQGGRIRLPTPVEEPLVKIMTGLELLRLRTGKERQEREVVRREKQEKEVEITWTIKDNDLIWSLNKIKQWLSEGTRVTVSLTRKRRWLAPPDDVCQGLIAKIREAVAEVSDVKESNVSRLSKAEKEAAREAQESEEPETPTEPLRGLGTAMTLSFVPKAKSTSLNDAASITVPWMIRETQLKQYLKTIGATLKKGRDLRIELNDSDGGKVKSALDREHVFKAIRSECRQAKDVRVKNIIGDVAEEDTPIIFEVMAGVSRGFLREIEVPANISSKDAELRIKWIDEWIKQGLEVTVWADPAGKPEELEAVLKSKLTRPIIKAEEEDSHGQRKFVVEKGKTEPEFKPVEMPAWKPAAAPPADKKQASGKKQQISATDLLMDLERAIAPPTPSRTELRASHEHPLRSSTAQGSATQRKLPSDESGQHIGKARAKDPGRFSALDDLFKAMGASHDVKSPQAFNRR